MQGYESMKMKEEPLAQDKDSHFAFLEIGYYSEPPTGDFSMQTLNKMAKLRLELLRDVENLVDIEETKKFGSKYGIEYHISIDKKWNEFIGKLKNCVNEECSITQADKLTHRILMLAYVNNPEWFIKYEVAVLAARLFVLDNEKKGQLIQNAINKYYIENGFFLKQNEQKKFLVPFEDVSSLMDSYRVKLQMGFAELEPKQLKLLLRSLHQRALWDEMSTLEKSCTRLFERDPRIAHLASSLPDSDSKIIAYQGTVNLGQGLTSREINQLATTSFPLCMSELHEELLKSHRLAHYGRLQFALFLKGMGLDVKDSIKFFKGEYSKSGDKKLNEYIYYIEHMYGIKGSRKDYAPYGCDKITKFNASGNEIYGCPFAYYSESKLKEALRKRIKANDADLVAEEKKTGHTNACRKYFSIMHPGSKVWKGVGYHPNSYFKNSFFYRKNGADVTEDIVEEAKTTEE